ncbi:MAG: restriction endonuclease subunit S [Planctomycetes bacterium]|nr:restriction endonuclease subunit S [Planctomycetota bacterium]
MADKRRVKDILLRLKTPVEIKDTEFYKRLTIRINHQGVSLRDTEIGAKIGTKSQFRVRAGDFILSKIDARQGAFGIVPPEADGGIITGNFWTFRVDNQLVDTEWFLQFTNSNEFLDLCKRSSTGNTHRKYLNENVFLNHELTIPSLKEQRKAVAACKVGNKSVEEVQYEITHQQSLLAKLKQAILQEAIQGKLTADWREANPDVEPASHLLQRIQAEKTRLIAEKKLRPEKPLPKITPAEIPFEIPKGWEWCRFLDVQTGSDAGSSPKCDERPVVGEEWGIIKVSATSGACFRQDENKFFRMEPPDELDAALQEGDFILSRANTKELAGNSVIVEGLTRNLLLSDKTIRFRISQYINSRYANMVNKAPFVRAHFIRNATGASPSMKNLSRDSITSHPFPLPPLAEQAAIVERVESLMTTCRALEAEIEQSRTHAAILLQAVLKEAFAPASVD